MRRFCGVLAVVVFAVAASAQERPAPAGASGTQELPRSDLRGVWKVTELASRAAGAQWEARATPHASQFIFTAEHYSYMYAVGPGPRKLFAGDPNRPTAAEKVEAYNSFVAAAGTYSLTGQTLTMNALVHKNPNEMAGRPLTYTIAFDGDTVRLVIVNPPFLPGSEWRMVLLRVE